MSQNKESQQFWLEPGGRAAEVNQFERRSNGPLIPSLARIQLWKLIKNLLLFANGWEHFKI